MYRFRIRNFFNLTLCVLLLFLSASIKSEARENLRTINATVIYDGPSNEFTKKLALLQTEILELTSGEFDVLFKPSEIISGEWNPAIIETIVKKAVESSETDFIICMGAMTSSEICGYKNFNKPVIATTVFDVNLQKIATGSEGSGIPNLNFLVSTKSFSEDIQLFQQVKHFETLTIVIDRKFAADLPFLDQFYSKEYNKFPFNINKIYSGGTAESVLSKISEKTEAVLFTPSLKLSDSEFIKVIDGINKKTIPGFTITGKRDLAKGLLAGLTPGTESKTKIRRIALNFQRILLGEKPENLSIIFSEKRKLAINMNTTRLTGIYPVSSVVSGADIISEKISPKARKLTLSGVIDEAFGKNLSIKKGRAMVSSGNEDVNKARSYLLPTIEANLTGLRIDENSAKISFGTESEESLKGSLSATQVLFSEKAWSGWQAVKSGQKAKEEKFQSILLDTAYETSQSYINVLRVLSLERVRKNSIDLTKANLKRARLRRSVGTAGASEVYRWESKLAMQKKALIATKAKIRQSKNNLNRILNRPLYEDFSVEDINFSNPVLCVGNENFAETISNPVKYHILKEFMVKKGLDASPEIKGLNAAIEAQKRLTSSARRDFFLPSVALQGNITEVYNRDGFDETDLDPTKDRDKTSWSVAINASFPLFTGGAKTSDYMKAKEETRRLKLEKKYISAQLEEKILYTIEAAKASYGAIKHSRTAATAARNNLSLVTDAYSRGVISIIELLDAQNTATISELDAENSIYNFMADLLSVQRAIGKLDFSKPANAKQLLRDEFNAFLTLKTDY